MEHIYWSFLLYVVYVLLPVVPAVVIYRMFPKTRASASGPLGNLKIKVGGAFGAYVITTLLGWTLVDRIDARIDAMAEPTWKLSTRIELQDDQRKPINDKDTQQIIRDLKVIVQPPLENKDKYPTLNVRLPLEKPDNWPAVRVTLPGFHDTPILLEDAISKGARRESRKRNIELKDPVVLRQLPKNEPGYAPSSDDQTLKPLPTGGPPGGDNVAKRVCASISGPRDRKIDPCVQ